MILVCGIEYLIRNRNDTSITEYYYCDEEDEISTVQSLPDKKILVAAEVIYDRLDILKEFLDFSEKVIHSIFSEP